MKIRLAKTEDIKHLIVIKMPCILKMIEAGNDLQYFPEEEAYPNHEMLQKSIDDKELYVVEEEKIIGFFRLATNDQVYAQELGFESNIGVHTFFVDINEQGKGVGTNILQFAEKQAIKLNLKRLIIDTHPLNQAMQRVAIKAGLEKGVDFYIEQNDVRHTKPEENIRISFVKKLYLIKNIIN